MPSFTVPPSLRLPARLPHARQLTLQREVAQRDARDRELLVVAARAARELAAAVEPRRARVARQLRELRLRLELVVDRGLRILERLAQRAALRGVLLDQLLAALVAKHLRGLGQGSLLVPADRTSYRAT